ncbi:MAG: non-homologous end-joining DNA ligase [Candidatus Rokuibacteriota bacterium]
MSTRVADIDTRRLLLTNLETPLWPEDGISKGDVVAYYLDIAGEILPFIANRPLSLLRVSDGVGGELIFQKTAPPGLPPWIPTRRIRSEHAALGYAEYVLGSDRAALVYLVNLGYISLHPWGCTVDAIDRPDQMLFDLDPTEIAFREVRNAALLVRDLLERYRIRSWVKTSGGRGLHVMVPVAPFYTFDQVRSAAETITRLARSREPSLFTFDMRRARRRGKILIDVHRNHRGATMVSPFSVREYSPAAVSMPLEWPELERAMYPEDFHLRNTRERLERRGNPLAAYFGSPQSLTPLLESSRARRARPLA